MIPASTRTLPVFKIATIARLMTTYVSGFKSADSLPTNRCAANSPSRRPSKLSVSVCSRVKARMTRTPDRFSCAAPVTPSSFACTRR